ncbi:MAG: DJ-1/PfpI family protein [Akkermansia sp.]|nr:DJ-1/PfpI family protein [Akkermansia sp.]
MKAILVLLAPGFEEIEFTAPVDILRRLGISVVTAGVQGREVEGAHGITMQADTLLSEVKGGDYAGIVLPGGAASWLLRDTPAVLQLVSEMNAEGKMVAAICAAPIALEAAGVLSGRRITCYPAEAVVADIPSAAEITTEPTVTDGNIITGRGPGAALEFGFALGAYLGKDVASLRREMQC